MVSRLVITKNWPQEIGLKLIITLTRNLNTGSALLVCCAAKPGPDGFAKTVERWFPHTTIGSFLNQPAVNRYQEIRNLLQKYPFVILVYESDPEKDVVDLLKNIGISVSSVKKLEEGEAFVISFDPEPSYKVVGPAISLHIPSTLLVSEVK